MDTPESPASLPAFAPLPSQRQDPPLPPTGPPSPDSTESRGESDPAPPITPSPDRDAPHTHFSPGRPRFRPGGDPAEAARVIAGLVVILTGTLGMLAARRGRRFRQPTRHQRDAIAAPLGRIAVRHLPLDALGPDLADATAAAAAAHDYIADGSLITAAAADTDDSPMEA